MCGLQTCRMLVDQSVLDPQMDCRKVAKVDLNPWQFILQLNIFKIWIIFVSFYFKYEVFFNFWHTMHLYAGRPIACWVGLRWTTNSHSVYVTSNLWSQWVHHDWIGKLGLGLATNSAKPNFYFSHFTHLIVISRNPWFHRFTATYKHCTCGQTVEPRLHNAADTDLESEFKDPHISDLKCSEPLSLLLTRPRLATHVAADCMQRDTSK